MENKEPNIRKDTYFIAESEFIKSVAGVLYQQAPDRNPRKARLIMKKVKTSFREKAYHDKTFNVYSIQIEGSKLYEFVDTLLRAIPEVVELNLSYEEYVRGVKVDDKNRPKYKFTSAYDIEDEDSWKTDFVDLDAFSRNVYNELLKEIIDNMDCSCCANRGTVTCGICRKNPDLSCHYKSNRTIRGKYTMACAYDCDKGCYICCEECDMRENCKLRCEGNPDTCGNVAVRLKKK